jgi:hypothetical protein
MPSAQNRCEKNLARHGFAKELSHSSRTINISKLKVFVGEKFPTGSPLREIILNEDIDLAADIFLARLPVWLQLSRLKMDGPRNEGF